jgi:hypothetical protein
VIDVQQRKVAIGSALFYERLEPLSVEDHGQLGVSLAPKPYAFLARTHAVPVTADEFPYAAVSYPIVFTRESKVPVALMGPNPGMNVFIAEDGEMDPDAYVPAYARLYPFLPISFDGTQEPLGGGDRKVLCIDRAAPRITDRPEMPFFENGQHSPFTRQAIERCQTFENLARRTRDLIGVLERYDLFETMRLTVPRANSDGTDAAPQEIEDCLAISEQRLSALPAGDYLKLRDMGIPGVAYAQLLSLGHWQKLLSRAARLHSLMAA